MSLAKVPLKDYRGGLNTRDSPFELQANESPDLSNVTVSSLVGQLETRKGKTRYDVSGLPEAEVVDYAKQVVFGSAPAKRFLMLSINGGIWMCREDGTVAKLHAGTVGTVWNFELFADAAFKDWVWCSNGTDTPQKWNGEELVTKNWVATKGAIKNGTIIRVWENRMFISGVAENPERIFFSEFGDPEATINEYGFVDVRGSEDDMDPVQDLGVLGSRLIVLKRRAIYSISSAVTMANRRIGGPGVWGRFQTIELEDKLYFFNPQGVWSTGGVEVTMESGSINSWFPHNLNRAALGTARLVATKDTYPRVMLAVATGVNTVPDTLIEMVPHINFRRIGGRRYLLLPAFFLHTLPCSALAAWNPTGTEELLIGAGSANSTAGKTTFPTMAVTDSFERANESPLSNGGLWTAFFNAERPIQLSSNHIAPSGSPGQSGFARFTKEELTSPALEYELTNKNEGGRYWLFVCVKAELAFNNGYEAEFSGGSVTLSKKVAGVNTILKAGIAIPGGGAALTTGTRIGITVLEGKIKVWINVAGKGWELITEHADASFVKGYSAIGMQGVSKPAFVPGVTNFRTGAIPAITRRLSTLFTGTTDEGTEIQSHWHSSWMVLQGEEPKERIRRFNLELQGDAVVDVFTDFSELPRFSANVPKGEAEGSEYRFARVRPETFGRFHSFKIRSLPGGQPFLINSMEVVYRGGKEH